MMSVTDELEIGTARPDEANDILRLMCEAFRMEFDAAGPIYFSDPYFNMDNKMVARLAGKVVSCLTIVDRDCWIGAATIKLAGIAGVATARSHRRQGIAGKLLEAAVGKLAQRGYQVAALYPEDRDFYRRFGWETAGVQTIVRRPITEPRAALNISIRLASESDIPAMSAIYNRASNRHALHCTRDAARWRYFLKYVPNTHVALDEAGSVVGYTLLESHSHTMDSDAAGRSEPDRFVRLLEMYCKNPEAVRALRGHVAGMVSGAAIQYSAILTVLSNNGFAATGSPTPALMARIIDWSGLLQVLARSWTSPTQSVGLVMTDRLASPPTRAVLVTGGSGGADVESLQPSSFPERCRRFLVGEVGAWSAVAIGHLSVGEACRMGALKASNSEAIEAADPLFPVRDPFIPTADHF